MGTSSWSEHSHLPFWLFMFSSWWNFFLIREKNYLIWFGLGGFLLVCKGYSKAASVAYSANMFWKYKQFVCLMTYQRCSAFKWDPQNISMINHCLNTFIQKLSLFIVHTLYISGFFLYPEQATQKVVQKFAVSGLAKGRQFEERWKRKIL